MPRYRAPQNRRRGARRPRRALPRLYRFRRDASEPRRRPSRSRPPSKGRQPDSERRRWAAPASNGPSPQPSRQPRAALARRTRRFLWCRPSPGRGGRSARERSSWHDLQTGDLAALQPEEESQINLAARKVAFQMAGHDGDLATLLEAQRLAGVGVFGGGVLLPLPDRGRALMRAAFVLDDRVLGEAPRHGLAVALVGGEIGRNRFRKIEGHRKLRRSGRTQSAVFPGFR